MQHDKRITFKCLGVLMEVVNITPEKFMSIVTRFGITVGSFIVLWRLPEIITALK